MAYKTLLKLLPRLGKELFSVDKDDSFTMFMLAAFAAGHSGSPKAVEAYLEKLLSTAQRLVELSTEGNLADGEFKQWQVARRESAQLQKASLALAGSGAEKNDEFPSIVFECLGALRRKQSVESVSRSDKATETVDHIAFTQILTPPWVVEVIYNETLNFRNWQEGNPNLYNLEDYRILDPCSGTGNFLLEALRRLAKEYQERGATKSEALACAITNNLFAADIDAQALLIYILRLAAMLLKAAGDNQVIMPEKIHYNCTANQNEPELNLGSLQIDLPPSHLLNSTYDLVVTNPPYLGRRLIDRRLKAALKKHFPDCPSDISLCFLERALSWVKPAGKIGFITQASLLNLPSSRALRQKLLSERIDSIIECGSNVFPLISGEKVDNIIITITKTKDSNVKNSNENHCRYLDLREEKQKASAALNFSEHSGAIADTPGITRLQSDFAACEDLAINFYRPAFLENLKQQSPSLGELAELKQGLATSDNERFLRYTWEVDKALIGRHWFPYCKGQGSRKWYGPRENLIYFSDNGRELKEAVLAAYPYLNGKSHWVVKNEEYYFKAGLTFTLISSHTLAVRKMPAGSIFDVGGSAIFTRESADENYLLAYLNSQLATALAKDINPTINYQVGDLKKIPVIAMSLSCREKMAQLALAANQYAETICRLREPHFFDSFDYQLNHSHFLGYLNSLAQYEAKLSLVEAQINELVFENLAKSLSAQERITLKHWLNQSTEKAKVVKTIAPEDFTVMLIASRLVQSKAVLTLSPGSINHRLQTLSIEAAPDFLAKTAPLGLVSLLNEKLPKYLSRTYNQQPPIIALPEAGNLHIAPTGLILYGRAAGESGKADESNREAFLQVEKLRQKCPKAVRARDILKVL